MARTLSEIYSSAKTFRDQYLGLTEKPIENGSKMSVLDAFTWVTSACIWTFDNLLEVFQNDVAVELQDRINGTPAYYANALLKFQMGDNLVMNEEGTAFMYAQINAGRRVISKVSFNEVQEEGFYDSKIVYKVAKGEAGNYQRLTAEELVAARAYLRQISFAGTALELVSRKGDVIVPRMTVYHDGAIPEEDLYNNIEKALDDFIANIDFDGKVYVQKVIDAVQGVEHVIDVSIVGGGIYVAQYDDNDNIIMSDGQKLVKVDRYFTPNGGFVKQSSGTEEEADIPTWRTTINFVVE